MSQDFLTNHFLLAMPALTDPHFHQSVTYICEHTDKGAMGIIVNRPADLILGDIFKQMDIEARPEAAEQPVLYGGPVLQNRGFVLHTPAGGWESTLQVSDRVAVTTSRDILVAMAEGKGPEQALVALGYAGWGAGQLEAELRDNAWLAAPADLEIMFATPLEKRWAQAARLLGVDPAMLSGDAGHA